ncbi:hypothetical protein BGZ76_009385 [Entomortierella beljakovae]|nr:hypothetical protein BGZ76_009385 [Entomortierella beljakovae]
MGRYNGPGAALRGQPRAPRQPRSRDDGQGSSNPTDSASTYSDRQSNTNDLPDASSTRPYVSTSSHQRKWSDASSLQGSSIQSSQYQPYNSSQNYPNQSGYNSSPASPPPRSSSPSSSAPYPFSPDHRPQGSYSNQLPYGSSQRNQQYPSSSQSRTNQYPNGSGAQSQRSGNGYNNYDQSPMMSPASPDSWRSPPGPRGYPSQNSQYVPSSQYRPQQQHPFSSASSVISNDDYGSHHGRGNNQSYDYDSDDYYNRQNGRPMHGNGQTQINDQGPGRYDRSGRGLSYSTSITSNSSSIIAARRERNERKDYGQQPALPKTDGWITSPTGTEQETEILSWSDDEAIVTKAFRSPPTGFSNEKVLPPLPKRESQQARKKLDSDMIKVEVGGATTVIPTTSESAGVNFVKSVSPSSPPTISKYSNLMGNQGTSGIASSLRSAAFNNDKAPDSETFKKEQPSVRCSISGGRGFNRIDALASDSKTPSHESRQQAVDSWRTSPPLGARDDNSTFTSQKNKRRSSLPDKVVPNWDENAQNWRSSIGQRRPSWMASSKGVHDDRDDDWSKFGAKSWKQGESDIRQQPSKSLTDTHSLNKKRLSDQSSHGRRSHSWSSHLSNEKDDFNKSKNNNVVRDKDGANHHSIPGSGRRGSFASTISRSRSPSPLQKQQRDSHARTSFSRSRSISRERTDRHSRYSSRSRSRSLSRSRSRSPLPRNETVPKKGDNNSSRFSWQSDNQRRSWESMPSPAAAPVSGDKSGPLTESNDKPKYGASRNEFSGHEVITTPLSLRNKGIREDLDSDDSDSPPLKVQYGRRSSGDDDDSVSSKHPVSVISTFSLPPATSPTSPPVPPMPMSSNYPSIAGTMGRPVPPPIPSSPPLVPDSSQSLMTSITTVSIQATTATMLSSRVSVESFKNVPGNIGGGSHRNGPLDTDSEHDLDTDAESDIYRSRPSYTNNNKSATRSLSISSIASTSTPPLSITTGQLKRNESSTSSISALSAKSGRSFVSNSSTHSASSIIPGSPPPQRAPPPIPHTDAASGGATIGSGLFGTKRSGSNGSARGVRSGLSKQILPDTIPLPQGPPPEIPVGKPSYGIIPPPIPSSIDETPKDASATSSSAIQIQMLADDGQSKSQMGAVTVEYDERELTRLNNRVAQLERELEYAQHDLEISQDDVLDLQNKVQDLESGSSREIEGHSSQVEELKNAKELWEKERLDLLDDMEDLRRDHQEELERRLEKEKSTFSEEIERLVSSHTEVLEYERTKAKQEQENFEDQKSRLEFEYKQATDNILGQLESLETQHSQKLEEWTLEHENKILERQREFDVLMSSVQDEASKTLEYMKSSHQQQTVELEERLHDFEKSLAEISSQRDKAIEDLGHHRKETEQALDRLEVVLAEDKQTHAKLIQELEQKSKRMEEQISQMESERTELMQDNVQIVEEMQRREELWARERAQLRSGNGDESEIEARLQEAQDQLVALAESKRQADSQFQGIVKGLLREASANKKEITEHQNLLIQERDAKEEIMSQLSAIQQEKNILHQETQSLLREKDAAHEKLGSMDIDRKSLEAQLEALKRSGDEALVGIQNELQDRVRQLQQELENEREKSHSLEGAVDKNMAKFKGEQFNWQTRLDQVESALKSKEAQVKRMEQEADATIKIQNDLIQSMERDAANTSKKLESGLMSKMKEMEMAFEEEKKHIRLQLQQEFAELYESESMEKENSLQQQLESIHKQELEMAKQEMTSRNEQQLRSIKQQHEAELEQHLRSIKQQHEAELEQHLRSMKQQHDSALEQQNRSLKQQHDSTLELQIKSMKQQHDLTLEQAGASSKKQILAMEEQLDKLQQQADQDRSEKESALKDRAYVERRMAGHDRRQKELEESLETIQQQLDQSKSKFTQELQEVERMKNSLERKLGMAKEDIDELNKIRDELENERSGLRQEVQRLKKSGGGSSKSSSSGADVAALQAEMKKLQEQVKNLEEEAQIMLERNMNLTIELSMK